MQNYTEQTRQGVRLVAGKQMPTSDQAERAVLAAILLNDDVIVQVAEVIRSEDFYNPAHRHLYQAIIDLTQANKRIDLVTLQDELIKRKQLDVVGGIAYLLSLQEDIPALGLVQQHAAIVKEKAVLRELISSASDIIERCYTQNDETLEAVIDHAEKKIFHIADKRTAQGFVQLNIWLKKTFQHLSDIKSHSKGITGVPSGYKKLDDMSSGFQSGDLIVLAGRPSMGKTALALNLAVHAAKHTSAVGIFSLEMSAEQLTLRMLSSESGIPHHNIRNATISSQEWVSLTNVAASLAQMKIFIDDTPMLDIMTLRAKARKLKREHGLSLLVVDYLQLLHSPRRHENRHQEVSEISRSLKALAKELGIPIIAGSQLSRAVDSRMDKRPMLSDLRESGAIEQDADLIMFLYREVVYNAEAENPALAELIIGKQRNGPTGTVYLNFVGEISLFEDMDDEYK
jgi:replicative DNA helicase